MLNDGHHHMSTLLIIYNQNFSGVLCLNKYIPQSYTRNKQKYENMENRGKVKNELRVQIYELWVQIHKLRVEIHELRVQIHKLRLQIHKLEH